VRRSYIHVGPDTADNLFDQAICSWTPFPPSEQATIMTKTDIRRSQFRPAYSRQQHPIPLAWRPSFPAIYAQSYVFQSVEKDAITHRQDHRQTTQHHQSRSGACHGVPRWGTPGSTLSFHPTKSSPSVRGTAQPKQTSCPCEKHLSLHFGAPTSFSAQAAVMWTRTSEKNPKPDHIFPTPPIHQAVRPPSHLTGLDMGARRDVSSGLFG
jgi:hypothetical protein